MSSGSQDYRRVKFSPFQASKVLWPKTFAVLFALLSCGNLTGCLVAYF